MLSFEWDSDKARRNASKHRVTFEQAARAFADIDGFDFLDDRYDYGEERLVFVGMVDGMLLSVAYTERGDVTRIISARRATKEEQTTYVTGR